MKKRQFKGLCGLGDFVKNVSSFYDKVEFKLTESEAERLRKVLSVKKSKSRKR